MRVSAALCVLGVVAAAGLGGCAEMAAMGVNKDSDPAVKQKVVTERVLARWDALIKGNVDQAYTFFSAGSKATTSLEAYKAKVRPGRWREAKIDKVECQGEVCEVTVTITYDHPRMKGIQMPLMESWIIENRSAWYVYR